MTGIGVGLTLPTLMATGASSLPPQSFATGSAVVNMLRQLGLAVGVAVLIAVLGSPRIARRRRWPPTSDGWTVIAAISFAAGLVALGLLAARRPSAAGAPAGPAAAAPAPEPSGQRERLTRSILTLRATRDPTRPGADVPARPTAVARSAGVRARATRRAAPRERRRAVPCIRSKRRRCSTARRSRSRGGAARRARGHRRPGPTRMPLRPGGEPPGGGGQRRHLDPRRGARKDDVRDGPPHRLPCPRICCGSSSATLSNFLPEPAALG